MWKLYDLVTQGWNLCTADTDTEHHKFDIDEDGAMLLLPDTWSDSKATWKVKPWFLYVFLLWFSEASRLCWSLMSWSEEVAESLIAQGC